MADGPSKKRVAAFTIAIGRVLGRSVQDIKTTATAALLRDYKVDSIPDVSEIVAAQRESYDGTGPKGLKGDDIPLEARIVAVADAFDAMTSGRVYQEAVAPAQAFEELSACSGSHFDPVCVKAFIRGVISRRGPFRFDPWIARSDFLDKQLAARFHFRWQTQGSSFRLVRVINRNRIPKVKSNRFDHRTNFR